MCCQIGAHGGWKRAESEGVNENGSMEDGEDGEGLQARNSVSTISRIYRFAEMVAWGE